MNGTERLTVKIVPRVSAEGHPFTEILYALRDGETELNFLTRRNYRIDDTQHARAHEAQQFFNRRHAA